jgi:hypothetical protein
MRIAIAQSNPAISKEYSNEEIAQMIKAFKTSNAHDVMPPAMLQQKFQADFPKAYDVEWETANNIYEIEFEIQNRDYKVYYNDKGNLLSSVEETYPSELPAIVKSAAEKKYPKYNLEDIDKICRGTEVFYKIEMENKSAGIEVRLLIKDNGTIVEETFDY